MSEYKHKNIEFTHFHSELLNRNNESFTFLRDIYDGKITYIGDFFPMLVNNMERLYKGVTEELQMLYPDEIKLTPVQYKDGHHFNQFADIIHKYIPISETKEGFYVVLDGIKNIQSLYNDTRFKRYASIEDFRKVFRRYEIQMSRFYVGLQRLQEREKSEKEDDLSMW